MFRRKKRAEASADDIPIYEDLRQRVLTLDPASVGIEPTDDDPRLYGAMMDTAFPEGTATLVALADGTTSLYTSGGGGMIGGGEHAQVARASQAFVRSVDTRLEHMETSSDPALPPPGRVIVRALGYDGHRLVEADEDDLGNDRHDLSPAFHAAHAVISELRRLES